MGTQRKKAEHVLFKSHFERRTSSTKRLHTTSAKSGSEDHTTLFRASDSVASSHAVRPKIDEKLVGNRRKSTPDRAKIDKQSILSRPGRPKSFWGRLRTRSERLLGTQMTAQVRSRDAPGGRRAAKSRPNASPGSPRDAPRASGTTPKMLVTSFASPNGIGSAGKWISPRFSIDARKLRSAFRIGFYRVLSMSDAVRMERSPHRKTSKKQPSRAPKSRFGASQGRSEEQVRAQKRPARAQIHARSALGAFEKFKVCANEGPSSEQERPASGQGAPSPECSEALFGNFEMDGSAPSSLAPSGLFQ